MQARGTITSFSPRGDGEGQFSLGVDLHSSPVQAQCTREYPRFVWVREEAGIVYGIKVTYPLYGFPAGPVRSRAASSKTAVCYSPPSTCFSTAGRMLSASGPHWSVSRAVSRVPGLVMSCFPSQCRQVAVSPLLCKKDVFTFLPTHPLLSLIPSLCDQSIYV